VTKARHVTDTSPEQQPAEKPEEQPEQAMTSEELQADILRLQEERRKAKEERDRAVAAARDAQHGRPDIPPEYLQSTPKNTYILHDSQGRRGPDGTKVVDY